MKGKKTGGRRPGSPNRITLSVKQALIEAFEKRGGVKSLLEWADTEPTEFYKLWAKMLPTEISGTDGKPIPLCIVEKIVDARDGTDDENHSSQPDSAGLPKV